VDPDVSRVARWLFQVGGLFASEEAIGDLFEEYAGGSRSTAWLLKNLLSTIGRRHSSRATRESRPEMLSNLSSDIRYTLRTLRRNPGFAAAAIAPIALGIGLNTGIFSLLDAVALQPLPSPRATELVTVYQQFRGVTKRRINGSRSMFSLPEYERYRDGAQTMSGVMAYSVPRTVTLGGESPREIEGVLVTCNYFDVLQRPVIGTGFTRATCDAPDAPPAVVLGHDLWNRAFGADRAIVGKTIALDGQAVTVVGVAPEGFDGIDLTKAVFFASVSLQSVLRREVNYRDPDTSWLSIVARRRSGVSLAEARAELAVIAQQIDQDQPGRTTTLNVAQARSVSLPQARKDIFSTAAVVLAAFGLLLLIACANVANLLLARAAGRSKEIAVRLSIGAGRARLMQQLLTESLIIAAIGGAAGSILAWWSFQKLLELAIAALPGTIPALRIEAHPNLTVLSFALALTTATGLLFGLAPAVQASRLDLQSLLNRESTGAGHRTGGWLRGSLVGLQTAICMILLISAGLLLRGLYVAETVEPGFEYRRVAVVAFDLHRPGYDQARAGAFQRQIMDRLASLAGVEAVAQAARTPLSPGQTATMFRQPDSDQWNEIDFNAISPEYFSLIGIPIVRGRTFSAADVAGPSRSVIITEATARRYWPAQDPIGRTLVVAQGPKDSVALEVVGVAADAQISQIGRTETSYMYLPAGPSSQREVNVLVRSKADFAALAPAARAVGRELAPGLVVRVNRLEENLSFWRTLAGVVAGLSGSLSLLALILASIGVYGVVSYVVSRRRREVVIRLALGANTGDIQRMILRQTLRPVGIGLVFGIAGAAAAAQILTSVLFGVSPFDPLTFVSAPLFLLAVAAAASLLPTRQALTVDPMTALRSE
jgi:predicted permease